MHVIVKVYCVHEELEKNVEAKFVSDEEPIGIEYRCPVCQRKMFLGTDLVP